jgi:hypothetical protein
VHGTPASRASHRTGPRLLSLWEAITYLVTEAFPARDPVTAWSDAQKAQDQIKTGEKPSAAVALAWLHLIYRGLPLSGGPAP